MKYAYGVHYLIFEYKMMMVFAIPNVLFKFLIKCSAVKLAFRYSSVIFWWMIPLCFIYALKAILLKGLPLSDITLLGSLELRADNAGPVAVYQEFLLRESVIFDQWLLVSNYWSQKVDGCCVPQFWWEGRWLKGWWWVSMYICFTGNTFVWYMFNP